MPVDTITASPATQSALSHMDARQGYRPSQVALGVAQPILAYPQLVDLANSLLSLLATDSNPYSGGLFDPTKGPPAGRSIVAGNASGQFQQLLRVLHEELRTETPDPPVPLLTSTVDGNDPTRIIYSRPLDALDRVPPPAGARYFTTDQNALAIVRTPGEVLAIAYHNNAPGTSSGGFFPNGVNGAISMV